MSRMLRVVSLFTVLAVAILASVGTVVAGSDTHVYGLVFVDTNLNGVWDPGEQGFAGATVMLTAGNETKVIDLQSAGTRALNEGEKDLCSPQDFTMVDSEGDVQVNPAPDRPCVGTWGLQPAGENKAVWRIELAVPAGYVATSPNPQYQTASTSPATVDFGIAPAGAGGPTAASVPLLPVTGTVIEGVVAALFVVGSFTLLAGRKLRK